MNVEVSEERLPGRGVVRAVRSVLRSLKPFFRLPKTRRCHKEEQEGEDTRHGEALSLEAEGFTVGCSEAVWQRILPVVMQNGINRYAIFFFATVIVLVSAAGAPAQDFGAPLKLKKTLSLPQAIARSDANEPVLVRGRIADVCQRKGCWVVLQDENAHARVRFADYGFFLPTDSSGREALVEGVLKVKTISAGMAQHYDEESGKSAGGTSSGARREVSILATGVRLLP